METVKKKISLEPFTSRQKSTIPFVGMEDGKLYESLNWGKIPYSVDFTALSASQEAVNAYGSGIRKLGKMTFSELMEAYHSVKNNKLDFPENDEDLTGEQKIEIEKLRSIVAFVDSKKIIDEAQMNPDPCCNPCFVPSPVEPSDMDSGDYYTNDASAFINVCIVQSANIVGAYTFATKDWVPGKRYFEGDKVIYDGKTYKLKEFSNTVEISGSIRNCGGDNAMVGHFLTGNSLDDFSDYPGLSADMFADYTISDDSEMVDMGYIYARKERGVESGITVYKYYIRPSWGGYYNRYDGNTYFDVLMNDMNPDMGFVSYGEYETEHWNVAEDIISHGEYHVTSCGNDVHIEHDQDRSIGFSDVAIEGLRWETKLSNFIRRTKTVTDSNEELQGKLNSSDSEVLDLIYSIGTVKNVDTTNEIPIGDFLADIQVIPTSTGGISIFKTEEHSEVIQTETGTYTQYTYPKTNEFIGPSEAFTGSVEKTADGKFIVYDELSNVVFVAPDELPGYDYEIYLSITGPEGENLIRYDTFDSDSEMGRKTKEPGSASIDFPIGRKSCNGDGSGFTIQPTGGTSLDFDVIAPDLLAEYGGSGAYVTFQNMDTYGKLVRNWDGETGTIILTYYVGAELELCEDSTGEEIYMYNGGEKRLVYKDTYKWTAIRDTKVVDGEHRSFVYLDIDYDSAKRSVVYENLNWFEDDVVRSDIHMLTNTMTEGGEPASENFQNADYFMEDYQLGLSFVANNNENVYIDRGNATAFERHMRLSEVDTLEDLENYGNGMFKMKE